MYIQEGIEARIVGFNAKTSSSLLQNDWAVGLGNDEESNYTEEGGRN